MNNVLYARQVLKKKKKRFACSTVLEDAIHIESDVDGTPRICMLATHPAIHGTNLGQSMYVWRGWSSGWIIQHHLSSFRAHIWGKGWGKESQTQFTMTHNSSYIYVTTEIWIKESRISKKGVMSCAWDRGARIKKGFIERMAFDLGISEWVTLWWEGCGRAGRSVVGNNKNATVAHICLG